MRIRIFLAGVLCLVAAGLAVSAWAQEAEEAQQAPAVAAEEAQAVKDALAAADAWLDLVDTRQYEKSWQEAAALFRRAVTEEQWVQSLPGLLEPLGERLTRTVEASDYRTALPGAPDGQYVVIRYKSSFANKAQAVETVTPMLDEDGQWRVSGYFIK